MEEGEGKSKWKMGYDMMIPEVSQSGKDVVTRQQARKMG